MKAGPFQPHSSCLASRRTLGQMRTARPRVRGSKAHGGRLLASHGYGRHKATRDGPEQPEGLGF